MTYITHAEYVAEQRNFKTLYVPNFDAVSPRSPSWNLETSPRITKKLDSKVGPGIYHDGIVKSQALTLPNISRFSIGKSKSERTIAIQAKQKKYIPGVGTYNPKCVEKKSRVVSFLPSKISRSIEEISKSKQWVPGPGTYDITPS